ncbi:hypothetical protein [Geomonas subterranea]|nr:hypothetical protein [Geomonas fuzhouensis]
METTRLLFYCVFALVVISVCFFILVSETPEDFPINLMHLLARH